MWVKIVYNCIVSLLLVSVMDWMSYLYYCKLSQASTETKSQMFNRWDRLVFIAEGHYTISGFLEIQSRTGPFRLYPGVNLLLVLQDHFFTNVPTKLLGSDAFRSSSPSVCRVLPVLLGAHPQLSNFITSPSLGRVYALCHTISFLCESRCGLPPLGLLPVCRCWGQSPDGKYCWFHFDCYLPQ